MGRYHELKELKNKYINEIAQIEGVYGVGIRVLENKIVVYCHEVEPLTLLSIPIELETVIVDVVGKNSIPQKSIWNQETPIPITNNPKAKFRPFPAGVNCASYNMTGGTVGIPMWSRKLNKVVMVSNNHVMADSTPQDREGWKFCRPRQFTNSMPITIQTGGTPYGGAGLVEVVTTSSTYTFDVNKPIITNLSPTNVRAGDIVTITGKSLGFRMGYSKVYFGNVQAKVKSWNSVGNSWGNPIYPYPFDPRSLDTDSTIEVYVPDNITGQVELRIEIEGDPITQPGRQDGGRLTDQVGQLEDYVPLVVYREGMDEADGSPGDVAIFSLIDDNMFANKIVGHGAEPFDQVHFAPGYNSTYGKFINEGGATGQEFIIQGVQEEFCEKLPIMKVGRTTGQTVSIIYDPSFTFTMPYMDEYPWVYHVDCVSYYDFWSDRTWTWVNPEEGLPDEQFPYRCNMTYPGDSGSTVFTATRQDYFNFMNAYELYHKRENGTYFVMTDADFDLVEQQVPIQPNNFIGNNFAGYMKDYDPIIDEAENGVCDKAINWMGTLDVYPLGLENPYMQIPMANSMNEAIAQIELLPPDTTIYLSYLEVNAIAEIECWVEGDRIIDLTLTANATSESTVTISVGQQISVGEINLTAAAIQPNNNISINLEFIGSVYNIAGSVTGNSETKTTLDIPYDVINLTGEVTSIAESKVIVNIVYSPAVIAGTLEATTTTNIFLQVLPIGFVDWYEKICFTFKVVSIIKNDVTFISKVCNNAEITSKISKEVQL